jgi:lipopolysaccharide transport system ATP-binding protein
MASLLEVGTGFHPELTGRENIFLNGAILGMTKAEITNKLDEIIDFSGCSLYIDTPVKRYSSGMKVRLGFAVAAFLDPEILVVDEVLAVGDAEFQKKAIGKMKEVTKSGTRTVLFVSHNMSSINALCTSVLFMENGRIKEIGETSQVIKRYLTESTINSNVRFFNYVHEKFELKKVHVCNKNSSEPEIFRDREIYLVFNFECHTTDGNTFFNLKFINENGDCFMVTSSNEFGLKINSQDKSAMMIIPAFFLNEGTFLIDLMVINQSSNLCYTTYLHERDLLQLEILPEKKTLLRARPQTTGSLTKRRWKKCRWKRLHRHPLLLALLVD